MIFMCMENSELRKPTEPAIVGMINERDEIHWRFSERLLKFISSLPEARRYPLIAHMGHDLGDDLAVLVINRDDLKKTDWHDLNDYL